jgi:hypothetical protein
MILPNPLSVLGLIGLNPAMNAPPEWYETTTALITQGPHWLLSAPDAAPGGKVVL